MNSENQIVTKITADIAGLKQGVAEAKQSLQDFQSSASNFTVNWDGGTGSIEDYNKALKQGKAEWEEYLEQQKQVAEAADQASAAITETATATQESSATSEQAASSSSRLAQAIDEVKTSFGNARDYVEGYTMRMNEATKSNALLHTTGRTAKAAITGLQIAMAAYAKSSLDEYAKSNSDFAATQDRVTNSIKELKLAFGSVVASLYPLIDGFTQFLVQNKEAVTIIAAAAAGILAARAAVYALGLAINVATGLTKGWLGVLGLLAGVAAAAYASTIDFSSGISDNSAKLAELQSEISQTEAELASAQKTTSSAGSNARKEIEKTRKELENLNFEFNQQLKQIAVNHEKTLKDLTLQIEQENVEYNKAIEERRSKFAAEQAKEEEEHQDKVDELTKQINFLQRYNNKYNKEKLAQLQYALEKENKLYQQRTEAEKAELDAQIEAEQASHEAKLASLQAELDDELAFQEKHRDALNSVRDIILLDEIESLQRQHDAQLISYNAQLEDAKTAGYSTGSQFNSKYIEGLQSKLADLKKQYEDMMSVEETAKTKGKSVADAFNDGFIQGLSALLGRANRSLGEIISNLLKTGTTGGNAGMNDQEVIKNLNIGAPFATGGYTGYGAPDEIAGVVHKGEYVLRADQVDQSTGTPKNMGQVNNIYVNGTFATSASERRKVAEQIATALNQVQKARLIK